MKSENGQTMLLIVIILSGVIFSAATMGGLLTFYQIRQSVDTIQSATAVFAADAGIEDGSYCVFKEEWFLSEESLENFCSRSGDLDNGASFETRISCFNDNDGDNLSPVPCHNEAKEITADILKIESFGVTPRTVRALEAFYYLAP